MRPHIHHEAMENMSRDEVLAMTRFDDDGAIVYAPPVEEKSNMTLLHEYLMTEPIDGLIGFEIYLKRRGLKLS